MKKYLVFCLLGCFALASLTAAVADPPRTTHVDVIAPHHVTPELAMPSIMAITTSSVVIVAQYVPTTQNVEVTYPVVHFSHQSLYRGNHVVPANSPPDTKYTGQVWATNTKQTTLPQRSRCTVVAYFATIKVNPRLPLVREFVFYNRAS